MLILFFISKLWHWLPRLVVIVAVIVIGIYVANRLDCSCSDSVDRTPEAQEERLDELKPRLIYDDDGNIIGLKPK